MAENVSTVGCSTKPVEYSQAKAGSMAMPETSANMNMKLSGWIGGRQRSAAEETAPNAMLIRMMMSPTLNESVERIAGSSREMIASTPSSETMIRADCPSVSWSRNIAAPAAAMKTGASEFITDTLSALVN